MGAYSINQNFFDVGIAVAFGVIGYLMQKYDFPLSPILLALILGPLSEQNFCRYMNIVDGNIATILTRPICVAFIALSLFSLIYSTLSQRKINKKTTNVDTDAGA